MNQNEFVPDMKDAFNDLARLSVDIGSATHQGHVWENNEDSYVVMRFGRSLERLSTNLDEHLLVQNYKLIGHGRLVARTNHQPPLFS